MEKSIKGTKTETKFVKVICRRISGKKPIYVLCKCGKKEGYEQIAGVFMETAEQEKEHAKKFFKYLEGGMVEITASYPAGVISTTVENLKAALTEKMKNGQIYILSSLELLKKKAFLLLR